MGEVGGTRAYDGPGLGWAPWKCPACAGENPGRLEDGCVHCGSGNAQPRHVEQPPSPAAPADLHLPTTGAPVRWTGFKPAEEHATVAKVKADMDRGMEVYAAAEAWGAAHEQETLAAAFLAGYQLAVQQFTAHTMVAPPVTADIAALAPEGKTRRTIIAALDLFKDQVLRDATEEIASGEWCSIEEVDSLILELQTKEGES